MDKNKKPLSRREMLALGLGIVFGSSVFAQEAGRLFTPPMDLGPFYPVVHPKDLDSDLTLIRGHKKRAEGEIVYVEGRVLNPKGEPVPDAKIEVWQANKYGRYAHPSDPNTAPTDENFQGYAVLKTDDQGRYRFKTVKPGQYPVSPTAQRAPHIHFDVMGKHNRLVTQMFFPNEPLNEKDILFLEQRSRFELMKLPPDAANAVFARQIPPTKDIAAGETVFGWDIVLFNG